MSKITLDTTDMAAIGNAIRTKLDVETAYKPGEMPAAILSIPSGGVTPTGTISIDSNGSYDVTQYASADVNVQPNLQSKTVTQNGMVTPDSGYDGLSSVLVDVSGGGGDLSQYDIIKNVEWEQGSVQGVGGNTWTQNKVSSTSRIRMVATVAVEPSHTIYVAINDGYDASVHQYNSSGKYSSSSGWGDYDNKGVVVGNPNIGITIRKTGDTAITPSEISNVGLAVYDITALVAGART